MKTKIIATLGPASEDKDVLSSMIKSGLSILRFNFSHTKYDQFIRISELVKKIAKSEKKEVKILQDLQGPRIRVGEIEGKLEIEKNKIYTFCHEGVKTDNSECIFLDDKDLHLDVKKGQPFYLVNGAIEMEVLEVKGGKIITKALTPGVLTSHRAINVPDTELERGGITEKDVEDFKFAMEHGIDYVALSFVQSKEDVLKLKNLVGKNNVKLVSKIERRIALDRIDEITQISDAIMIARGDLGIEIPLEDLPIVQKHLVKHAHWHDTPAIIATEMMTSMIKEARPTRAEVNDIANAIFDGADAVMLSDETAIGAHPEKVVATMQKIILRAEKYLYKDNLLDRINGTVDLL